MAERDAVAVRAMEPSPCWWERRWFLALAILATMVPLLYSPLPPLVDLPGHVGRYRVEIDLWRPRHRPARGLFERSVADEQP